MTEKSMHDPFGARAVLNTGGSSAVIYRLESLEKRGLVRHFAVAVFDQGIARIGAAQL